MPITLQGVRESSCKTGNEQSWQEFLGSPVVPFYPFSFWVPLKPNSRNKGTLIIKGLLGNLDFVRVEKACVLVNPGAVDGVWLTPTPQTPYAEANMFGCFRKIVLGLWGLLVSSPLEST